jgi:FeS assembly SUF system regulator
MLRMTKLADYGIVMLTHFASSPTQVTHNARDIASAVHLPLPMVSKVLKVLAREGLLVSHRGTKGGYSLARRPGDISIAEIIRALEGPIAVTECTDTLHGDCDLELLCPVRGNWHRINQAIREALESISLAEMTQPLPTRLVSLSDGSNPAQVSNIT